MKYKAEIEKLKSEWKGHNSNKKIQSCVAEVGELHPFLMPNPPSNLTTLIKLLLSILSNEKSCFEITKYVSTS